ncbi:energy transducer TonB [Methylophilus sp. UBA6697]|uniref:energy transducer TonB n=1 Tax=Methylophilus sp. UBA6697 TaxID=1946902 RepID=UPI0025F18EB6|nr:energy transducer TonB [Methylophilus sp. UBA6697]
MSSLIYPEQQSDALLWRAVMLSLGLHLLIVAVYPSLSQIALPNMPEKLEIEFFSIKALPPRVQQVTETAAPVEPPKATPMGKPQTPVETPKQILAAPSNHEADYRVPEQAAPTKVEPAAVSPAPAAPSVSAESAQHAANDSAAKDAKPSASAPSTQANVESDELSASDSDAWGDYGEQLRALVSKSKQYPAIAIRRHLEGEATVVAQFVRGELVNVSLTDSSKHVPLDEEAMRMVKKAIAQLGVKDSLRKKSFKITIPVAFKLE